MADFSQHTRPLTLVYVILVGLIHCDGLFRTYVGVIKCTDFLTVQELIASQLQGAERMKKRKRTLSSFHVRRSLTRTKRAAGNHLRLCL